MRPRILFSIILALVAVFGSAIPATAAATTTRLYMSNDGTGCPGRPYLSLVARSSDLRCGFEAGAPFGELYHAGLPLPDTRKAFSSRPGLPSQLIDAMRHITGNVRVTGASQSDPSVGQVRVDVKVYGTKTNGEIIVLGSSSSTQTLTGQTTLNFPLTIEIDDAMNRTQINDVTSLVDIRGVHVFNGYHQLNGASYINLPTLTL